MSDNQTMEAGEQIPGNEIWDDWEYEQMIEQNQQQETDEVVIYHEQIRNLK